MLYTKMIYVANASCSLSVHIYMRIYLFSNGIICEYTVKNISYSFAKSERFAEEILAELPLSRSCSVITFSVQYRM